MSLITLPGGIQLTPLQLAFGAVGLAIAYVLLKPSRVETPVLPLINSKDELCEYVEGGKYIFTKHDSEKPVLRSKTGVASRAPSLVMTIFKKAATTKGDLLALESVDGKTWTWRQYYDDTITAAKALVSLGFKQFDTVSLIGFNSPEWLIGNLAAIAAGGKAAGIYTTNQADALKYIVEHSDSKVAIVEDEVQLNKFLVNINSLPLLKTIIVYKGKTKELTTANGCRVMNWDTFMNIGAQIKDNSAVEERMANTKPGHCALLIYTSGTTGNPKGCMISHDAILYEAAAVLNSLPDIGTDASDVEHMISYLPLSHIAGQMLDVYCPIIITAELKSSCVLHFADANALKGSLGETLRAKRPTLFLGVPRVWEKIAELMKARGKATTGLLLKISTWAKAKGMEKAKNCQLGGSGVIPPFYDIADKIVFKNIKKALGLDRCKFALTGAAPITKDTLMYFGQLGLQINEVYGMSESCAATTFSTNKTHLWGSCGFALSGMEIWIDHQEDRNDKPGEGELCYRGRHIMMGYLKDEQKSKEAIDSKGWLHSGDIGRVDSNGMYYITGRIKELIVSAGGEKYAPIPCEDAMKKYCPGISNVMMVGDKRKYNVLLVTLKSKTDKEGNPLDALEGEALDVDPKAKTVAEAKKSELWDKYIKAGMKKYNDAATSNAHRVQYHTILDKDFTVNGGELTATLKLKRAFCDVKYKKEIDSLYKDE